MATQVSEHGQELAEKRKASIIEGYVRLKSKTKTAKELGVSASLVERVLARERDSLGLSDIRFLYADSEDDFNNGDPRTDEEKLRSVDSESKSEINRANLVALIESQGFRCALSGAHVEPDGASLDHKTPLSMGGEHSLENVQWVSATVNRMKGQMSVEQFVEMCVMVAEHSRSPAPANAAVQNETVSI